jgi:hypothetical protein
MERLALFQAQNDETWVQGEPRPDLLNSYACPADMLRPQYLSNYAQFSLQARDAENKAIMTNADSPILVYTFKQKTVSMWSHELQMAIMYGLAANICTPLTGKTTRSKLLYDQANAQIMRARESAANMNEEQLDSLPDWIAGRGYCDVGSRSRFFYPFAGLLTSNVG